MALRSRLFIVGASVAAGLALTAPASAGASDGDRHKGGVPAASIGAERGVGVPKPSVGSAYVNVSVATVWTSPTSPRSVDRAALANPVDILRWIADMSPADESGLITGNRTQTQALYGQRLEILGQQGEWIEVAVLGQPTPKHPLGYPGWIPRKQLASNFAFAAQSNDLPFALIDKTAVTWLYDDPALTRKAFQVSVNTRLPVLDRTPGAIQVATPDRGPSWLSAHDASVYASAADIPHPTATGLVEFAELFLDRPYLWGGRSGFAFDCSGLTSTVYQTNGITLPRDADPQAHSESGRKVGKEELRPGDLLFYARDGGTGSIYHVAMYVGGQQMIEARGLNPVQISPVRFDANYWGAKRFLEDHPTR